MTSYVVELAPAAEADIHDAFRLEVFEVIDRLAQTPLGKAADEDGNRRRAPRRFPYSVVCEMQNETVTVLAVAHHRRQPNYWKA